MQNTKHVFLLQDNVLRKKINEKDFVFLALFLVSVTSTFAIEFAAEALGGYTFIFDNTTGEGQTSTITTTNIAAGGIFDIQPTKNDGIQIGFTYLFPTSMKISSGIESVPIKILLSLQKKLKQAHK